MKRWANNKNLGFTIVELLIVIVVIGILAAITIVAFNNIQERARYTTMQQDISSINKAVMAYHAIHGAYPYPSGYTGNYVVSAGPTVSIAIPGIVPDFAAKLPQIPNDGRGGGTTLISLPKMVPTINFYDFSLMDPCQASS